MLRVHRSPQNFANFLLKSSSHLLSDPQQLWLHLHVEDEIISLAAWALDKSPVNPLRAACVPLTSLGFDPLASSKIPVSGNGPQQSALTLFICRWSAFRVSPLQGHGGANKGKTEQHSTQRLQFLSQEVSDRLPLPLASCAWTPRPDVACSTADPAQADCPLPVRPLL
ncbi:hypothetical protein HJG60_009958 [Phyllostomus discolor]|uniref:Uncharacterized protein n=1 Tax=Phyllostomus discolor TaxID=89673 RepID=A0A834EQN3_9CHIR|nr:hypothetical protein HJG60_009958 [Phyllostomus discolor]